MHPLEKCCPELSDHIVGVENDDRTIAAGPLRLEVASIEVQVLVLAGLNEGLGVNFPQVEQREHVPEGIHRLVQQLIVVDGLLDTPVVLKIDRGCDLGDLGVQGEGEGLCDLLLLLDREASGLEEFVRVGPLTREGT